MFAIFLRDLKARFSGYALGTLWLIVEPLLLMIVMVLLLGARGAGAYGYADPPVFILAGMVAFRQLWQPTQNNIASSPKNFRALRMFRQVKLFDLMLARALVQIGLFLCLVAILTAGLLWLGYDALPNDPLAVLAAIAVTWTLSIGVGLVFAVLKSLSPEAEKLINMLQMPLLFLSAVIYPMTVIPPQYHSVFAINPLVHMSEWLRQSWIGAYESPVLDIPYFLMWTLCALTLGMMLYRLTRKTVLLR